MDGQQLPAHANDPNEVQIQYNLYRIPFNDGKGGQPEPILGASNNGMSNNFPESLTRWPLDRIRKVPQRPVDAP